MDKMEKLMILASVALTFFLIGTQVGRMVERHDWKVKVADQNSRKSMFIGERTFWLTDDRGNVYRVEALVLP